MTDIDDLIDQWHESTSNLPLHEFLGMTFEQYASFVATGIDPRTPNPQRNGESEAA